MRNIACRHFICAFSRWSRNRSASFHLPNMTVLRCLSDAKKDVELLNSDKEHSYEVEKQLDLERIREMQKYFEQYTEEYVEIDTDSKTPCKIITKSGMYCYLFTRGRFNI